MPGSLLLPGGAPAQVLACGAELKNTFCVAKGERAWVSHHVGDLQNYETLRSFTDGVEHFERLFAVEPALVAHDLHPEYLSTKYALERDGVELVGVQHHHAHLAACLAEHGEQGPAVGAIFDGTGYGPDGTVWGGELLLGDLRSFERVGTLVPVRPPGWRARDQASRGGWPAPGWLRHGEAPSTSLARCGTPSTSARGDRSEGSSNTRLGSPQTTSMGRLFDAVAALIGVRAEVNYEGRRRSSSRRRAIRPSAASYPISGRPVRVLAGDRSAGGDSPGGGGFRSGRAAGSHRSPISRRRRRRDS